MIERTTSDDGSRYYHVRGETLPSVTTILNAYKPKQDAIRKWRQRVDDPDHLRDRAALVGTLAHHRILNRYAIRDLDPPPVDLDLVDDELEVDVETACVLWDELGLDIAPDPYVEQAVWSEKGYAGTFDLLSDSTVYDLKTSRRAWDSSKLQLAAYYHACREQPKVPDPEQAAVVVLNYRSDSNLQGHIERLGPNELDEWYGEFLSVLAQYRGTDRF